MIWHVQQNVVKCFIIPLPRFSYIYWLIHFKAIKESNCSEMFKKCNRRCDICKCFPVVSTQFTCHATNRKHKTRGTLTCNTKNIIYLIACKCCSKQYIGSATSFKERFRIHKCDFDTGKMIPLVKWYRRYRIS